MTTLVRKVCVLRRTTLVDLIFPCTITMPDGSSVRIHHPRIINTL